MMYARVLWYVAIALAIVISLWAGIKSLGYFEAGQAPQFIVFGLLSLFSATFVIGSKPWLGTRRFSSLSNVQTCPHCGYSNLSSSLYCVQCGSALRTISQAAQQQPSISKTCVTCGASVGFGWKFCATCGQPLIISVKEVLNSTLRIIRTQPIIIVPIFIELLASNLLTLLLTPLLAQLSSATNPSSPLASFWASRLRLLLVNIAYAMTVTPLVHGMYPSMVQNVMGASKISITQAGRRAVRKFTSLSVSNGVAYLATVVGALLLAVPGLIMATWYYYIFPAIILEDRGALDGLSASRAFGRSRKWETFLMLLVASIPTLFGGGFILLRRTTPFLAPNSPLTITINIVLGLVASVLGAVMASYTYIRYGMPKSLATPPVADPK